MVTEIRFRGWQRPAIGDLVTEVADGRAHATVPVDLAGEDTSGGRTGSEEVQLTVALAGPGDVEGLQPGAIARRFPHPGTVDAETTKCPYVELTDPTLPWRYVPQRTPGAGNRRLRPWLVLVVGDEDEIVVGGDAVTLAPDVLRAHPLADSHRWAHVQEGAGSRTLARVLSTRPLRTGTSHIAALVPAFALADGSLADAWPPEADDPVSVPVYAHWRFRTGPGGDFRTLAASLRPGAASTTTGVAPVRYPRVPDAPLLGVRGALAPVGREGGEPPPDGGEPPPDADAPLPEAVATDLARLRTPVTDQAGRPILGLPRYGEAWHQRPEEGAWGGELNRDPRRRGVAGVGLRLGVELQERLAAEASRQAGALDNAAQRLRHLSLGLAASGSLWRRRLPASPARRLWTLGPALRRVMTAAGSADAVATAADRPLPAGWFSTAARRVLRPGPPRTALANPVATDPVGLHEAANRPPPPVPFAETSLPSFGELRVVDFEERRAAIARGSEPLSVATLRQSVHDLDMNRFPTLQARLVDVQQNVNRRAGEGRELPWVHATLALAALAGGEDDPHFDAQTAARLLTDLQERFDELADADVVVRELFAELGSQREEPPPSRPVDVTGLAGDLAAAFDPTGAEAPARRRVLSRIDGLDPAQPLAPPEPCPGLDLPAWRELARLAPDWLLPGVGQLDPDVVIALETNPVFVDAFLIGLNTRALEELRWRNLRVAAGCTPLRTFWTRADTVTDGRRVDDIIGVRGWTDASQLGDAQHRPPGLPSSDLVLVVRSRLFQRYPETLFYLVSARHGGVVDFARAPDDDAPRSLPSLQGRIGPDVTFFGFQGVPPSEVTSLWAVLEEPPSGFSFRNDVTAVDTASDGAEFADQAFDDPVRVLIQGDTLIPGGES
jgi:hypothetical protein